jgi:hypothetical protein
VRLCGHPGGAFVPIPICEGGERCNFASVVGIPILRREVGGNLVAVLVAGLASSNFVRWLTLQFSEFQFCDCNFERWTM